VMAGLTSSAWPDEGLAMNIAAQEPEDDVSVIR
jgi:hypothetical protein